MDWASITGILLVLTGIIAGHTIEGGKLSSLVQPAAFLIVFVGTIGAVLLQNKLQTFRRGINMLRWVVSEPPDNTRKNIQEALNWSLIARREGFLSLERTLTEAKDPFISKGLRLIIDGVEPGRLREILEADISLYELEQRQAARIWDAAGGYSPTVGILGAVLGLIHVMDNLAEPSKLGAGIARIGAFSVADDLASGDLVPLLEAYNPGDQEPIHAVFVGGAAMPARVRAFVDFLVEHHPA